ncbi:SAM-dependent methyltransferase [Dyella choica]|nr:class I SAM-dependent methyltransferase [Dyella choica]
MSIKPFLKLLKNDQLTAFTGVNILFKPFYRLAYLSAAKQGGLLDLLSEGPASLERLAALYCQDAKAREALEAWLQLGVRLGFLQLRDGEYGLKGLARKLALPQNDAPLALLQEVAGLHHKLILNTLEKLKKGELWSLADQDGELIARSSRALEVFLTEAIDLSFPVSGAGRLLEIGCGSGYYIKYAVTRNASLSAIGLELQPDVAEVARRNIQEWGLEDRVEIENGDIQAKIPDEHFDIVTLYNNIYYFPVEERVAVLRHIGKFLKPGGFLLLTTCCQGGNLGIEVLNLWGAATASGGRLPSADEMVDQLQEAGYRDIVTTSLIPGDRFYAFKAYRGDFS